MENSLLMPDLATAEWFLTLLDESTDVFTFQVIPEREGCDRKPQIFHASLKELTQKLIEENQKGAGIFVTINRTNGEGRKKENITAVRAVFVDLDGSPLESVHQSPITPHMILETSPGRFHVYWMVQDVSLEDFERIQTSLAKRFGGDVSVHDLPRCMRLPGFYHQKGEPFQSKILEESCTQPVSGEELKRVFEIEKGSETVQENVSYEGNEFLQALNRCGMIISCQTHPAGSWNIRCPWERLHSKNDLGTKYYEPNPGAGYRHHGFQCFHEHCKGRTIKDLKDFLGIKEGSAVQILQPLFRPMVPAMMFPVDALGPTLKEVTETLHRVIGAPISLCAQSVLGCAGLVVQPYFNIIIDGRIYILSLYMINVGESGERKTGVDNIVLDPVREHEKMMLQEYSPLVLKYKNALERYEKRRKQVINSMDDLTSIGLPPEAPLDPIMILPEPTFPALVIHLARSVPSVGVFSAEGGSLVGGHSLQKDNMLNAAAGFSSFWDKGDFNRARVKDGVYNLYGKRVSLNLMIQPVVAEPFLSNKTLIGQGFFSRCLLSWPESTIGSRLYVREDLFQDVTIKRFLDQTRRMLDEKMPVAEGTNNELSPQGLLLCTIGYEAWVAFHDEVEKKMAQGGEYYGIKGFASKAPDNALRIAGILFGFEMGPIIPSTGPIFISPAYVENAIKIMRFYLSEALRILGLTQIDPDLMDAHKLLGWLRDKKLRQFPTHFVYQSGPAWIRDAKKARQLLQILQEHGWIKKIEKGQWEGKDCKELWELMEE